MIVLRKRRGTQGSDMPSGLVPENIVCHELIGLECTVARCTDKKKAGAFGKIIDETQKTLTLETRDGDFLVGKKECAFDIRLPDGRVVEVDGRLIFGRPEERIKKKFPKSWREVE